MSYNNMKINTYISVLIILLAGTIMTLSIRKPSSTLQWGLLIITPFMLYALIYSLYSFIRGLFQIKKASPLRFLPLLSIITILFVSTYAGVFLNTRLFKKCKPPMEQFIKNLDDKKSFLSTFKGEIEIPDEISDYIYGIHTQGFYSGKFEALFFYGGGFPVKHSAWYYSSDNTPPKLEYWSFCQRIESCWYRVND